MKIIVGIVAVLLFILMASEMLKILYRWLRFGVYPQARPMFQCLALALTFLFMSFVYHAIAS